MTDRPKPFANTQRFYGHLGWFHAVWLATELNIDCAICKILKISPEQTHALVGPLEFGRKAAILRSILPMSDYKNVEELKGYLTRLPKAALRNTLTHSFIASDETSVSFIHREGQGQYKATIYKFEADNFVRHCKEFVQLAHDFETALGFAEGELARFAAAAVKEEKSDTTSPQEPSCKA